MQSIRFSTQPNNAELLTIQSNIDKLARHHASLEERLKKFGEYLSESRALQASRTSNLVSTKEREAFEEHQLMFAQLASTREALAQQQARVEIMTGKTPRYTNRSTPQQPYEPAPASANVSTKLQHHLIDEARNYNSEPNFVVFKQCSMLAPACSSVIFRDSNIRVDLTRTEQGISLQLSGSHDYVLRVGTLESDHIHIPWSRFTSRKFLENCDITNKLTQATVSVPVPLPLSYLFEKRLGCLHHPRKFEAMKDITQCFQLRIRHYDRSIWQQLLADPELYHFRKQSECSIAHAISFRGTRQMFLVQITLNSSLLVVSIWHRAGSDRLNDLLEFYGFLLVE